MYRKIPRHAYIRHELHRSTFTYHQIRHISLSALMTKLYGILHLSRMISYIYLSYVRIEYADMLLLMLYIRYYKWRWHCHVIHATYLHMSRDLFRGQCLFSRLRGPACGGASFYSSGGICWCGGAASRVSAAEKRIGIAWYDWGTSSRQCRHFPPGLANTPTHVGRRRWPPLPASQRHLRTLNGTSWW